MASKKQRITNKKHTKSTYNQRLVNTAKDTNIRLKLVQSENPEDKEKLEKQRGRKSFAEIAVEQELFNDITDAIFWWCSENPYYSQKELMDFLISEFSSVFAGSKTKYPQSFYKNIEKVDAWFEALKTSNIPTNREILRLLYKDARDGSMSHKDAMNFVRLMHDSKLWDKEDDVSVAISAETSSTLDEINRGLKELGGGDIG